MDRKSQIIRHAMVIYGVGQEQAELMVDYELARLKEQYRVLEVIPTDEQMWEHLLFILYNKVTAAIQDGMVSLYKDNKGIVIDFTPRYWTQLAASRGVMVLPAERMPDGSVEVKAVIGSTTISKRYGKDWIDRVLSLIHSSGIEIDEEFADSICIKHFVRTHSLDKLVLYGSTHDVLGVDYRPAGLSHDNNTAGNTAGTETAAQQASVAEASNPQEATADESGEELELEAEAEPLTDNTPVGSIPRAEVEARKWYENKAKAEKESYHAESLEAEVESRPGRSKRVRAQSAKTREDKRSAEEAAATAQAISAEHVPLDELLKDIQF